MNLLIEISFRLRECRDLVVGEIERMVRHPPLHPDHYDCGGNYGKWQAEDEPACGP